MSRKRKSKETAAIDQGEVEDTHDDSASAQGDNEVAERKRLSTLKHPKLLWAWALVHKKISIPTGLVLLLLVLAAVPFTRYLIAGTIIQQSLPIVVLDAESNKPVSSATVLLGGKEAITNGEGRAEIRSKVGNAKLKVTKKYYESSTNDAFIPMSKPDKAFKVMLKAKGRVVPLTIVNSISKKPAANVNIEAVGMDTEAKTDDEGKANLVVPAGKREVKVTLSGEGFNNIEAMLQVTTDEVDANKFSITPSGKVYFLSNASGKIDLVKSDLDGSNRQTVLAGTGKEDRNNTILIASRDWKYITLLSKRDGGEYPKLFLIETANDKVTTMDEGQATFETQGWIGDRFIYVVNRDKKKEWEPGRQALKSYHAPTKKITTLDETHGEGNDGPYWQSKYIYEYYSHIQLIDQEVVFAKNMNYSGSYSEAELNDRQASLNVVKSDGSGKKAIKKYTDKHPSVRPVGPDKIQIMAKQGPVYEIDEYYEGKIQTINKNAETDRFYSNNEDYIYYNASPSGNKTLWSKNVDGKNAIFVGGEEGKDGKEIGRSQDFTTYDWLTDNYILLSKKGSELYIIPATGLEGGLEKALKITDYYATVGYY